MITKLVNTLWRFFPRRLVPDEVILARLDPWLLACAVGAMNGSIYGPVGARGAVSFDVWLVAVDRKDWKAAQVSEGRVEEVLRAYAQKNFARPMQEVLEEEERRRGLPHSVVLAPGESVQIVLGPESIRTRVIEHEPDEPDEPSDKPPYRM